MKQLNEIVEFFDRFPSKENEMAVAVLFHVDGSTYRKVGSRMLIHISGDYAGGISGGCLESDIQKKAKLNLLLNRSEIVSYNTSKKDKSVGENLGCDGKLEILLCPVDIESPYNPVNALREIQNSRDPEILITIVRSFNPKFENLIGNVYNSRFINETLANDFSELGAINLFSEEILISEKSQIISLKKGDDLLMDVFVEFIAPPIQLIIVGEQKDVISLAQISNILGWKTILCGRKNKYSNEILKSVEQIEVDQLKDSIIDEYTAIVFMSHDFDADVINLQKVIDSNAFYIGMLGPERRKIKVLSEINKSDQSEKINGPIGINLGSKTPEEIALATCAEIQLSFSQKKPHPQPLSKGEGRNNNDSNDDLNQNVSLFSFSFGEGARRADEAKGGLTK